MFITRSSASLLALPNQTCRPVDRLIQNRSENRVGSKVKKRVNAVSDTSNFITDTSLTVSISSHFICSRNLKDLLGI